MNKKVFEEELVAGMHQELMKQASGGIPAFSKAAECLHAALEIFEEQGLHSHAARVLQLLQKIAASPNTKVEQMPSIHVLMEAGLTQRDLHEFSKGNPIAKAKFNLILRKMGLSEHQIGRFIGTKNVMSEEDARKTINPNSNLSPVTPGPGDVIEFKSLAAPQSDPVTKGWTPEKGVKNLKEYGMPMKPMSADDGINVPPKKDKLSKDDLDVDFADLLDAPTFDIDASDDELMGMEVKEDSLEVFDKDIPLSDFEDER